MSDKVFNRDVKLTGGAQLYVNDVRIVDSNGNLDAPVTTTAITATTGTFSSTVDVSGAFTAGNSTVANLLFTGILRASGTPQTLTGPGAVNLTTFATLLVTTGADALTLAAGAEGQFKFIRMKTDGGDGTLTVTNLQGGTTLTFNDAGDFVLLFYLDAKRHIIVNSGCTLA